MDGRLAARNEGGSKMDDLQGLIDSLDAGINEPPSEPTAPKQAIKRVNYSHNGMINLIIANRGISQNAIAAHFGYSASWVSQVMSSDAFQAKLAERASEIEDPTLKASVEEGFKALVHRSMEILKAKLDKPEVPDNLVLRTLDIASRAAGYGAKIEKPPEPGNANTHLLEMAGNLTRLLVNERSKVISTQASPRATLADQSRLQGVLDEAG